MKKIIGILLLLMVFANPAWAKGPFNKFGRGLTNIVTSPLEYVVQTVDLAQDNDYLTAFFGGLAKGTYFMVARILTGVYDVVTFPVPLPANYEPLWRPETVFETSQDWL